MKNIDKNVDKDFEIVDGLITEAPVIKDVCDDVLQERICVNQKSIDFIQLSKEKEVQKRICKVGFEKQYNTVNVRIRKIIDEKNVNELSEVNEKGQKKVKLINE